LVGQAPRCLVATYHMHDRDHRLAAELRAPPETVADASFFVRNLGPQSVEGKPIACGSHTRHGRKTSRPRRGVVLAEDPERHPEPPGNTRRPATGGLVSGLQAWPAEPPLPRGCAARTPVWPQVTSMNSAQEEADEHVRPSPPPGEMRNPSEHVQP